MIINDYKSIMYCKTFILSRAKISKAVQQLLDSYVMKWFRADEIMAIYV